MDGDKGGDDIPPTVIAGDGLPDPDGDSPIAATAIAATEIFGGDVIDSTQLAGTGAAVGGAELATVPRSAYRVIREHDRGGLGRILDAVDTRTGRRVAIKEMLGTAPELEARFRREAMITAHLQHPSIVPVYEVGRWPDGQPFYAMKLVEGRSLLQVIDAADSIEERIALLPHLIAVADAVAYAHSRGVLHRDLKPANVLVGSFGETIVIDWGLAKTTADGETDAFRDVPGGDPVAEQTRGMIGTPAYMAPEQATGAAMDERTDVYALGAMLYHTLAGASPYSDSELEVSELLSVPPTPLDALSPDAPADLRAIVGKAMQRSPDARYPTAAELAAELDRYRRGQLVAAREYSRLQVVGRFLVRHRAMVSVIGAAALLLLAIGVVSFLRIGRERDAARSAQGVAESALEEATRSAAEARSAVARLQEELGVRELAAQRSAQALTYLAGAASAREGLDAPLSFAAAWAAMPTLGLSSDQRPLGRVVDFDRAGDTFAAIDDRRLAVWQGAAAPAAVSDLPGPVEDIALAPDGARVALAGEEVSVRDLGGAVLWARRPATAATRVDFSRDGERLAYATLSGEVHVVATRNGETLAAPTGLPEAIDGVVCGRDCERVLVSTPTRKGALLAPGGRVIRSYAGVVDIAPSSSADQGAILFVDRVALIDMQTGRERHALPLEATPSAVVPGPGGELLVTDQAGRAWLWNPEAKRLRELPGHPAGTLVLGDFSATGDRVLTADEQGQVRLWDVATASLAWLGQVQRDRIWMVGTSADEQSLLALSSGGRAATWRLEPSSWHHVLASGDEARRAAYRPGHRQLATSGADGVARLFDAETGALVRTFDGHDAEVRDVAFSPDGSLLATVSVDATARVWDVEGGTAIAVLRGHERKVKTAVFSPAGDRLWTGGADTFAIAWDTQTWEPVCRARGLSELFGIVAVGDRVATYGVGGIVHILDRSCAPVAEVETGHTTTLRGALSPDGRLLAFSGHVAVDAIDDHPPILVLDAQTGQILLELDFDNQRETLIAALAFADDSKRLAAGGMAGGLRVWDLDGTVLADATADSGFGTLAFLPGGELLIDGSLSGQLRVRRADTLRLLWSEQGPPGGVYHLALPATGDQVAAAGVGDPIELWPLPRWSGDSHALAHFAACRSPWVLRDGSLALREGEPDASCAELLVRAGSGPNR